LELLVVLAIIGITLAGVSLSLRASPQAQLEREAQRLIAVLEAARAQSRTSGIPLIWQATADGFTIRTTKTLAQTPNTPTPRNETWLTPGTQAAVVSPVQDAVVLGPEPLLAPSAITLSLTGNVGTSTTAVVRVGTTGLTPFRMESVTP
jgi:general secretion pathway protein H